MKIHTNMPGPLLARLRRQWGIKSFVETGTAHGDTAELAAMMFDEVRTCEIDPQLVAHSRDRLKGYPNVQVTQEYSFEFLSRVKNELPRPIMYWLDGHWCGGPVKPAKECPLLDELEAIGGPAVVLMDDFELIESPPAPPHDPAQWPTMDDVRGVLARWEGPWHLERHEGPLSTVMVILPEEQPVA